MEPSTAGPEATTKLPAEVRVAFLTEEFEVHKPTSVIGGPSRCALADVVIVRELAMLHDEALLAADESAALDVFHIVAMGTTVVGAAAWLAAKGRPAAVRSESIIEHEAASGVPTVFRRTKGFADVHPIDRPCVARRRGEGGFSLVGPEREPASGGRGSQVLGAEGFRSLGGGCASRRAGAGRDGVY